ncbi:MULTISPECIES: ATP-binding cassette domain-containing protein [Aquitalea]|uniref:phosphonate ABC transporter ATP-binding protein n=1 Tax=Aquitalea TaxID=407217 RepID=UPI0013583926|nr:MULTISPECIES: ATP-binding cassette domain-containing protein [Aquitalea]
MSLLFDGVSLQLGGVDVLRDIRLELAGGEQAALIGPSGAGKTSLLLLAATRYRPSQGSLSVLGDNPWHLSARWLRRLRSRIGMVYQAAPLPARQRVIHSVAAGKLGQYGGLAALTRLLWPNDGAAVQDCLQRLALADKLWQRCDQLSGGQRQRVGIARVLYQQADLLLADEPVAALDPRLAEDTISLLVAEAHARQASLLVSLHSVELALAHFPRIIGVRDGQIMFDLPREQVHPGVVSALYAGERLAEPAATPPAASVSQGLRC